MVSFGKHVQNYMNLDKMCIYIIKNNVLQLYMFNAQITPSKRFNSLRRPSSSSCKGLRPLPVICLPSKQN